VKEDAEELRHWQSMVDCASEIPFTMTPAVIAVDAEGLLAATGDEDGETATAKCYRPSSRASARAGNLVVTTFLVASLMSRSSAVSYRGLNEM